MDRVRQLRVVGALLVRQAAGARHLCVLQVRAALGGCCNCNKKTAGCALVRAGRLLLGTHCCAHSLIQLLTHTIIPASCSGDNGRTYTCPSCTRGGGGGDDSEEDGEEEEGEEGDDDPMES